MNVEHHFVLKDVERLDNESVLVADEIFEEQKKKCAQLKDQLHTMIVA